MGVAGYLVPPQHDFLDEIRVRLRKLAYHEESGVGVVSSEEVKKKLEYATSLKYKGRTYSWEEADYEIKGRIPRYKLAPAA